MSQKKTSDNVEPIKLDTTLLKIEVKTVGDLVTKEYDLIPFHPNMSDMKDLSNNNYILFPSFVKITQKYLENAGLGNDFKKIFTQLDKYVELIKYVTNPERDIDEDFTLLVDKSQSENSVADYVMETTKDFKAIQKYEPLTDEEIITNNIGLIKSIFLPPRGRFFILGHEYIINKSTYIHPYIAGDAVNQQLSERKKVPLKYTITVELELLDAALNPDASDFGRLSCKQKKASLDKDMKEIFGDTLGKKDEVQVVAPPAMPTTATVKRGFGKLQIEWEERNKYVKPPANEKERLEQEKNMTPLQKKMLLLDKQQADFNKIPPLWIKERKELDMKYETFIKQLNGYKKEIADIKQVNNITNDEQLNDSENSFVKDLIDAVKEKADVTIEQFYTGDKTNAEELTKFKEESMTALNKKEDIPKENPPDFLIKYKVKEEGLIDQKYVAPSLLEMKEKEKDVESLKADNKKLSEELKVMEDAGDKYNQTSKLQERAKIQAILLKKQTDLKLLEDKYGSKGEKLIKKWEESLKKMKSLKAGIDNEKTNKEKKEISDTVTNELKKKMEEIKLVKENINKANFFEGNQIELVQSEKDKYAKTPGDRPVESAKDLKDNLNGLEADYLEIANKLGVDNKRQGYITLLSDNLKRIKSLKDDVVYKKGKEEKKIRDSNSQLKTLSETKNKSVEGDELRELLSNIRIAQSEYNKAKTDSINDKNNDEKKRIMEEKKEEKDNLEKQKKELEEKTRTPREKQLQDEVKKSGDKIEKINLRLDVIKAYESFYDYTINQLRKGEINIDLKGEKIDNDYLNKHKEIIDGLETIFVTYIQNISQGNGTKIKDDDGNEKTVIDYKLPIDYRDLFKLKEKQPELIAFPLTKSNPTGGGGVKKSKKKITRRLKRVKRDKYKKLTRKKNNRRSRVNITNKKKKQQGRKKMHTK